MWRFPRPGPSSSRSSRIAEESVIVTAGAAPTIERDAGQRNDHRPEGGHQSRQPFNLTQTVENVAGVSSVSEGQAAVPAIRGLARGRSLILIDGARVSSERRVGPSATYMDPFVLDGVDVARGPGSVAYGSDAFGGVIAARTLGRRARRDPCGSQATGDYGVGIPGGSAGAMVSTPIGQDGGFLVSGHYRSYGNWDSPEGEVFNSGFRDSGVLVRASYRLGPGTLTAGWQGDYGRDIDRPRNNSTTVRFFYPEENSSRFTLNWESGAVAGFSRIGFVGLLGSYDQITEPVPVRDAERRRDARAGGRLGQRLPGRAASRSGSSVRCASRSASTSTAVTTSTRWTTSSATPSLPRSVATSRWTTPTGPMPAAISRPRLALLPQSCLFRAACATTA